MEKQWEETSPSFFQETKELLSQVSFSDLVEAFKNLSTAEKTDLLVDLTPLFGDIKGMFSPTMKWCGSLRNFFG